MENALKASMLVQFLISLLIYREEGSGYRIVIGCTHKFFIMMLLQSHY
jgi:hypothetical protein